MLKTEIAKGANANAESLRTVISNAGWFAVLGGVPLSQKGDDLAQRALLLSQAKALVKDLQARLDKGAELRAQPAGATDLKKRDQVLDRIRNVFGHDFIAMPRFTCGNGAELVSAQAATVELQGGDLLAAELLVRAMRARARSTCFGSWCYGGPNARHWRAIGSQHRAITVC